MIAPGNKPSPFPLQFSSLWWVGWVPIAPLAESEGTVWEFYFKIKKDLKKIF